MYLCSPNMTRLKYWMVADTQYGVHSPFVFEMYRKVLFASVGKALRGRMCEGLTEKETAMVASAPRKDRAYHELVYKLRDHYGLRVVCYDEDEAVLKHADTDAAGLRGDGLETVKVVCRPHRCHARELRWRAQQGNEKYNVSIDMYDVGVLMMHRGQCRQHFILR